MSNFKIVNIIQEETKLNIKSAIFNDNDNRMQVHLKNFLPTDIFSLCQNFNVQDIALTLDISDYVQNALNFLISNGGGTLFVDPAIYPMKKPVTVSISSNVNLSIVGTGGTNNCIFDFYSVSDGFVFNCFTGQVNFTPSIEIRNISILASGVNIGTAIKIIYDTINVLKPAVNLSNLYIAQNFFKKIAPYTDYGYWSTGISMQNGRTIIIKNVSIIGEWDVFPGSFSGISLCGEVSSVKISESYITECNRAITTCEPIFNMTEGIFLNDTSIEYCDYGIVLNKNYPNIEPQLSICNCAFNTSINAIDSRNYQQTFITNCLFYASSIRSVRENRQNQTPVDPYFGVVLGGTGSAYHCISNNIFTFELNPLQRVGTGLTAIDINNGLPDGVNVSISGNIFFGFGENPTFLYNYPIVVRQNVKNVFIDSSNSFKNCATGVDSSYITNETGSVVYRENITQTGITSPVASGNSSAVIFSFGANPNPFPLNCKSVILTPNSNTTFYVSNITKDGFTVYNTGLVSSSFYYTAYGS